jgi:hypothetical protein
MVAHFIKQRFTRLAMAALLPLSMACSDNETTGPSASPLLGRWQITSFEVDGVELMDEITSMEITFTTAGTYTVNITNDALGTCGGPTSCTESGTYTATSTRITLDPGSEDETVFNFAIQGNTMTFTWTIAEASVTMVLQKL